MRRLVPVVLVAAVALAACGGDDDSATDTTAAVTTTEPAVTTPVDPDACFEVPAAATVTTTTVPPTTIAADTTAPAAGPTLPATTVPPTTAPASTTPDTGPGTTTPGVEGEFPAGVQPAAVRPCEQPPGLQITVLRPGEGRPAQAGDTLYIDYIGIRSEDGAVFDESYSRGVPIDFPLGQGRVIQGWDQGLLGAQPGALIRLDIPTELAYNDSPSGDIIQPGDALTFVTEVRLVAAPTSAADNPAVAVPRSEGATETSTVDLVKGTGPTLEQGQTAVIHAMFVRGDNLVVLNSTWAAGSPEEVMLVPDGLVLPGLVDGLIGANVGSRRVITMPPSEAYGDSGAPSSGLPAGVDLIVVLEVLGAFGQPSS
ncbi:MAG TPA: FKBP-type peptidyl-prolyl cis-trans isomerase [Ilumatobacter sp.]|nr:FKBP-type peptidyl-prolyl cis-trans isomerase [Ilumatobacter sp.]